MSKFNYASSWRRAGDKIDFAVGQPSRDLLPLSLMAQATAQTFAAAPEQFDERSMLQYGESQGEQCTRESVAKFLAAQYAKPVDPNTIFITNGVSQAIDLVCNCLLSPGDSVIIEEPTYHLATHIFLDRKVNVHGVKLQQDGMDVDALEEMVKRVRPKLVYTIPVHNNPTSVTLSVEKRQKLVQLSVEYNFTIVADEVYQLLTFPSAAPPPPSLYYFDEAVNAGTVIAVHSFSKITAPGLRLGWIHTSIRQLDILLNRGYLNSGGGLNPFTGCIIQTLIDNGGQDQHLSTVRAALEERSNALVTALQENMSPSVSFDIPKGGYFVWLKLPSHMDAKEVREHAIAEGVSFQVGPIFAPFAAATEYKNCIRLCFAYYEPITLVKGAKILADVIKRVEN